ncbi:hypothetical protein LTR28_007731 [Elasticomyces elasticus]|nr:hypothetical protein LTR28_007731 [Elasticomyces elasticus]
MRFPPPLLLITILSSLQPVHSQTNIGHTGAATGTTLVSTYTMTRTVLRVVETYAGWWVRWGEWYDFCGGDGGSDDGLYAAADCFERAVDWRWEES